MEIKTFELTGLRNEEHFQFITDFKTRVTDATPAALSIAELYAVFLPLYADEDTALEFVSKSAYTESLALADNSFNDVFRGLRSSVKLATIHFNPAKKQAAKEMWVVFEQYGNIAAMPYLQQTGAATNLLQELTTNHSAGISLIHVDDYVTQLGIENRAINDLLSNRIDEKSQKTLLRMKEVRQQVDDIYNKIVERINAGIIFNGLASYEDFVRKMNEIIAYNANVLALRKGRNAADNNNDGNTETGETGEGGDTEITPQPL